MTNRAPKTIWLITLIACVMAGCVEQEKVEIPVPLYERLFDPNYVIADYALEAIETTGGKQAWSRAKKLEYDCVVTFYQPDGSFYMTEHYYEIYPWENSIRITAREPQNKFVWQLCEGQFSMSSETKQKDISPVAGFYRDFSESVLIIITTPIQFLDENATFTKFHSTVKIWGTWYQPFQRTRKRIFNAFDTKPSETYRPNVIFYRDINSSLVDTILFSDYGSNKFIAVRGYDYTYFNKNSVLVPTKIEVLRTDAFMSSPQLLAEINFKQNLSNK